MAGKTEKEISMLREWVPAEMPEEEELKTRLEAAREKLAVQQLQMKEKKVPVLVLVEGWGTSRQGFRHREHHPEY